MPEHDLPPTRTSGTSSAPAAGETPTLPHGPDPATASATPPDPGRTAGAQPLFPSAGSDPTPLLPPEYELVAQLGAGGMGVVYQARDVKLNRVVALKMLLGNDRTDTKAVARFLVEAQAVAAVRHPNVVQVYHGGEHLGRPYLVLELCPGGSLADRLRDGQRLDPRAAAELVRKIAAGVAAAHARGIVHRDLKPGNILFDDAGEPKVADFGLAKSSAGSELTRVGDVMGTPAYMAPEQAGGRTEEIDRPADVWAVGVILYECLTGGRPFGGQTPGELLAAVQHREPTPPRKLVPTLPGDIEFICLKCLRKEPKDRYADAAELAAELGRFLAGEPLGARRRELGYRMKKAVGRWWRVAAAAGVLVAVLLGVWAAIRPEERPPGSPPGPAAEDPLLHLKREEVAHHVETYLHTEHHPDRESPHPVRKLDELPPVDMSGVRVRYDDRVIDLRGCRAVHEPGRELFILSHTSRVMRKTTPIASLRTEWRTRGRDVVPRVLAPNADKVTGFATDRPAAVGRQQMKARQVVYDLADIPVNIDFTVQDVATFWDPPMSTADDRWFGAIGYGGSVEVSMLLLFPADRPFTGYRLRVAPTKAADPVPYTGPLITFKADDNRWLYWEVPKPQAGQVYRVEWDW